MAPQHTESKQATTGKGNIFNQLLLVVFLHCRNNFKEASFGIENGITECTVCIKVSEPRCVHFTDFKFVFHHLKMSANFILN